MKTKQPTQVSYRVNVVGVIWQGCESTYSYSFDHKPTPDEVLHKAGDFQRISDYQVIETRQSGNWNRETTKRRIVRDWQTGAGENAWYMREEN